MAHFRTWVADRVVAATVAFALTFSGFPVSSAMAAGETRSLKIYFVHTGERANIVFKRNGRYDPQGIQALSRLLRDWRRNEPTRMDPRLFDLVWQVYQAVGATEYINAVSGYRSPTTNEMLRSRTKGVAKNSQHRLGKAMDFYIPGVPLKKLRETAMRFQGGGVGYYPTSNSPFVHIDVGGVRSWPRMPRNELVRLFPDGKTMHIPADGTPLPGYQQALAEFQRNGGASSVMMADASPSRAKKKTFLTALFGGGDEDEEEAPAAPVRTPRAEKAMPAPQQPAAPVQARELPGSEVIVAAAPVPAQRPAFAGQIAGNGLATALYSSPRSTAQEAIAAVLPAERPQTLPAGAPDLAEMAVPVPVPTLLSSRNPQPGVSPVVTASISPDLSAGIPVPAARPAVAESLMAGANADPEAEEDEAEQQALSRDMLVALTTSGADARRDFQAAMEKAASATVIASRVPVPTQPDAAPKPAKATEVAALEPVAAPKGRFGDVFDTPVAAGKQAGIEAGLPEKGGRPQKAEADKARRAMTSGTAELTGDKLAQWAFSRQRQAAPTGAFKAPRVLAQTMAAAGAEDRPQQLETDQDRFKGNSRVLTVNIR